MSALSLIFILVLLLIITIPVLIYTFFFILKRPTTSPPTDQPLPCAVNGNPNKLELATVVVVNSETESGGECPVCLSALEEGEELWRLNLCSHLFHASCIQRWLHAHSDCPVCRAYVKPPPKHSLVAPATRHQDDLWQGLPDSVGLV